MEISDFQSLLMFLLIVLFVLIVLPERTRNNVTKNYKSFFPMTGITKIISKWIKYNNRSKRREKD